MIFSCNASAGKSENMINASSPEVAIIVATIAGNITTLCMYNETMVYEPRQPGTIPIKEPRTICKNGESWIL